MKKWQCAVLALTMLVLLVGCTGNEKQASETGTKTFAEWSEYEAFANVPALITEHTRISQAHDAGGENYVIDVSSTNKEDYENYLKLLESEGFEKYVDNGENGLDNRVYTATYTKDNLVLTVNYIASISKVYISVSENQALSEHLFYKEEYVSDNIEGKKTTLSMMEMYDFGNSFVIQLKNGHFIISDGGVQQDMIYLLEYLEKLAPEGQKPVVDAWFISHAHSDHNGALASLTSDTDLLQRIYIDGIYLSMPNNEALAAVNSTNMMKNMMMIQTLPSFAKASDGSNTKLYRPQTGQKYYFCDVVVDIMHTQEQLPTEDYANMDLNDSSMWTMFHIDKQKFMLSGDADKGSMSIVMRTYPKEYFAMDIYASFHHNLNNWLPFLELCTVKTTLFTTSGTEPQNKAAGEINGAGANAWLMKNSLDYYSWEDGGKVLTFPYKVGTAKSLPMQEWIYHASRERTFSQSK